MRGTVTVTGDRETASRGARVGRVPDRGIDGPRNAWTA